MRKKQTRISLAVTLVLAALMSLTLLAGCGGKKTADAYGTPANDTFYNPIKVDAMLGDPWMYRHDGAYYYTNSNGTAVTLTKSNSMTGLMASVNANTKVLFRSASISAFWAPEIFYYKGFWYCYFTATQGNSAELLDKNRRTYALRSKTKDAMGEWDFIGKIDLPEDQWSIDATFFENNDGSIYIIWSGWQDDSMYQVWKQDLYITQLEDGDPTKVKAGSPRVKIIEPTYDWETSVLPQSEGPEILKSPDGTVQLVYSGNFSGSDKYCLAYATLSGDPMRASSWTKADKPLMQSSVTEKIFSPGHCSFVKSPDGTEDWMVYHAAKRAGSGWDRVVRLQKLEWNGSTPTVGKPTPINSKVQLPSGEKVNRRLFEAEDAAFSEGIKEIARKGAASGDTAVQFASFTAEITFTVRVDQAGSYPLYIRCSNGKQTNEQLYLETNSTGSRPVFAPMTPGVMYFYMTSVTVDLKAGDNTIVLTSQPGIDVDCLFVDYENIA